MTGRGGVGGHCCRGGLGLHQTGRVAVFIGRAEHLYVVKSCFVALCDFERKLSVVDVSWTVAGRAPVGDVVQVGKLGELLVHLVH